MFSETRLNVGALTACDGRRRSVGPLEIEPSLSDRTFEHANIHNNGVPIDHVFKLVFSANNLGDLGDLREIRHARKVVEWLPLVNGAESKGPRGISHHRVLGIAGTDAFNAFDWRRV